MATVFLLTISRHSSGRAHLSMASHHLTAEVAVVVEGVLIILVVVMKPLLWALQFAWDLTTREETRWLKRAMAFLINMQIIRVLLYHHFLNQRIKVIRLKTSLKDSVRHLTPIHFTLALIGAEEI
jgi:hypothetical protein